MARQEVMDRVWQALTRRAGERRTITYGELANEAGPGVSARNVGREYLDLIWPYCQERSAPNITSIVVLAGTGRPSDGYTGDHARVLRTQAEVIDFDWSRIPPPTIG